MTYTPNDPNWASSIPIEERPGDMARALQRTEEQKMFKTGLHLFEAASVGILLAKHIDKKQRREEAARLAKRAADPNRKVLLFPQVVKASMPGSIYTYDRSIDSQDKLLEIFQSWMYYGLVGKNLVHMSWESASDGTITEDDYKLWSWTSFSPEGLYEVNLGIVS